jgi:hypothetical protein
VSAELDEQECPSLFWKLLRKSDDKVLVLVSGELVNRAAFPGYKACPCVSWSNPDYILCDNADAWDSQSSIWLFQAFRTNASKSLGVLADFQTRKGKYVVEVGVGKADPVQDL